MTSRRATPANVAISAARVQIVAPASLGETTIAALAHRGIDAHTVTPDAVDGDGVIAWAFESIPSLATTVELAATCKRAATSKRPVCLLVPEPRGTGRAAIERHAAIAFLRAHGAAIGHDVDAWLESIVCLVRFGLPAGPRTAIIAPEGSWLESQAITLANDLVAIGQRAPIIGDAGDDPTDVALYDPALGAPPASTFALPGSPTTSVTPTLAIACVARGELAGDSIAGFGALYGARAACGAIDVLGRAAARVAIDLGPAPTSASAELSIDREKLDRELAKQAERSWRRIGDHETKVLLSAYRVEITRQAVALTPSAAVKIARKAGYPVEMKAWGPAVPPEPACPVEKSITSDALVRNAFTAIVNRHTGGGDAAAIVRETPPPGREVNVSLLKLPSVGWTVVIDAAGRISAAPCPLRVVDAEALATAVVASRAGDPEPDRLGLANLLRRASHLVVDLDARLLRLELPRVIVGGRGVRTLVVDAYAELA